jgi:hypothetical protein
MTTVVLDTDVVSLYRAGRLPAGLVHQVVTNDSSIAFATAGELWNWALTNDGEQPAVAGSTSGSPGRPSSPPAW